MRSRSRALRYFLRSGEVGPPGDTDQGRIEPNTPGGDDQIGGGEAAPAAGAAAGAPRPRSRKRVRAAGRAKVLRAAALAGRRRLRRLRLDFIF